MNFSKFCVLFATLTTSIIVAIPLPNGKNGISNDNDGDLEIESLLNALNAIDSPPPTPSETRPVPTKSIEEALNEIDAGGSVESWQAEQEKREEWARTQFPVATPANKQHNYKGSSSGSAPDNKFIPGPDDADNIADLLEALNKIDEEAANNKNSFTRTTKPSYHRPSIQELKTKYFPNDEFLQVTFPDPSVDDIDWIIFKARHYFDEIKTIATSKKVLSDVEIRELIRIAEHEYNEAKTLLMRIKQDNAASYPADLFETSYLGLLTDSFNIVMEELRH